MANVSATDDGKRVTCDLPACKSQRAGRGQENGRWLFNLAFDLADPGGDSSVTVTVRCHECGGVHTVVFPVPRKGVPSE